MLYYEMVSSSLHTNKTAVTSCKRERVRSPEDLSNAGSVARLNSVAHPILHPIRCRCHTTSYIISAVYIVYTYIASLHKHYPNSVHSAGKVLHACFPSGSTHHLFVSITTHNHTLSFPGYNTTIK